MSKKTIITSQTLALAAAGKLAVQSTAVSAEEMLPSGSKLSEVQETENVPHRAPRMRMDQIGTPLDILVPPTDDFMSDFDADEFSGSKYDDGEMDAGGKAPKDEPVDEPQYFAPNGVIFTGDIDDFSEAGPRPKIDFIISNVPNKTVDLFLLYSDRPFGKKKPGQFDGKPGEPMPEDDALKPTFENPEGNGALGIPVFDPATGALDADLKFIAGMRIEPQKPVPGFDSNNDGEFDIPSPFGKPPKHTRSVVISVSVNKLSEMVRSGQIPHNIFFQAAAFPTTADGLPNIDFKKAIYSDVDQFIIEVPGDEPDEASDSGTKGGAASAAASGKTASSPNEPEPTEPDPNQPPSGEDGTSGAKTDGSPGGGKSF